ncbi:MAG: TIGR03915 family putative DNA repair protein [Christensenellales bacterium]|jgi:probable DNA metabolism protein
MHNRTTVAKREGDISYTYDGSFEGLLCCVFRSVRQRERPISVIPCNAPQMRLFESFCNFYIETDFQQADIVRDAIEKKISPASLELIHVAFLSCLDEKELHILRYLELGFKVGPRVDAMLAHPVVSIISESVRHLHNEAHLLKGFVRFSDYGGVLAAQIEPKNRVLFAMAGHFCDRFGGERLIIYDKNHGEAFVCAGGRGKIVDLEEFELPAPGEDEALFRSLWMRFHQTIAIKERYNPACQRGHLPLRYRGNMTEFTEAGRQLAETKTSNPNGLLKKEEAASLPDVDDKTPL